MWASSNGKSQNQNFNYLSGFCVKNYQIDARFKKGHLKFINKKNIGDFIPMNDASGYYIFFAMKGNLKL